MRNILLSILLICFFGIMKVHGSREGNPMVFSLIQSVNDSSAVKHRSSATRIQKNIWQKICSCDFFMEQLRKENQQIERQLDEEDNEVMVYETNALSLAITCPIMSACIIYLSYISDHDKELLSSGEIGEEEIDLFYQHNNLLHYMTTVFWTYYCIPAWSYLGHKKREISLLPDFRGALYIFIAMLTSILTIVGTTNSLIAAYVFICIPMFLYILEMTIDKHFYFSAEFAEFAYLYPQKYFRKVYSLQGMTKVCHSVFGSILYWNFCACIFGCARSFRGSQRAFQNISENEVRAGILRWVVTRDQYICFGEDCKPLGTMLMFLDSFIVFLLVLIKLVSDVKNQIPVFTFRGFGVFVCGVFVFKTNLWLQDFVLFFDELFLLVLVVFIILKILRMIRGKCIRLISRFD